MSIFLSICTVAFSKVLSQIFGSIQNLGFCGNLTHCLVMVSSESSSEQPCTPFHFFWKITFYKAWRAESHGLQSHAINYVLFLPSFETMCLQSAYNFISRLGQNHFNPLCVQPWPHECCGSSWRDVEIGQEMAAALTEGKKGRNVIQFKAVCATDFMRLYSVPMPHWRLPMGPKRTLF